MKTKDHFPVLDITEFQGNRLSKCDFLYHELHGERHIDKPHKHDFFLFLLFEKGNGIHSIDFVDYILSDHQIHLLFPDQVHRWTFKEGTTGYQLMISRPIFEVFSTSLRFSFIHYRNYPVLDLSPDIFEKLLYEFKAIQQNLNERPVFWDLVHTRSKIIALLVSREAEDRFKDFTVYNTKPQLFKYLSLIDTHFKEEKTVSFYAEKLNITANYLNILCKRHFHVSATSLIQNRVVLEAKRLIQASELSIKEIAFELGFYDHSYFSNFFKTQTGIAPTAFKKQ
ncbi:helix-turn-helix domain-containing protein [Olivibacter sp. SDN3]|uniref:AraC family transcriptional regulator n=1 Tax=Olivibacter sp. SDN3 TaxID=2764720 RepID=UPI0016518065|nr:helix-turn-helix transcriptional regulator [Olivibacter sp. SDN3]QNL49754.1 helix-turn-helix domain-containing protein [Olivibacter sp. SDN3]